jgi:4-hydroxy-L-threonine phosphate dehydrogenase PdxA
MSNYLPIIGITMGDASGVGPEVIVKSLNHDVVYQQCRPLVIGDAGRQGSVRSSIRAGHDRLH